MAKRSKSRCSWARSAEMVAYHDQEWGVPVHEDRKLFEFLILEGAQAGLSWEIILRKREAYREAFDHFDAKKIARYDKRKVASLLKNAGIVRNRLKIAATITNAKAFLAVQEEFGSFDKYLWGFVKGKAIDGRRKAGGGLPAKTDVSDALSRDLLMRGFKFVGSTICYAMMQAVGIVNDHAGECFRYREVKNIRHR